jgi:hypothetical protein
MQVVVFEHIHAPEKENWKSDAPEMKLLQFVCILISRKRGNGHLCGIKFRQHALILINFNVV